MLTGYALLALQNIPHFLAGGSSRESWLQYHARAIDTAIRAGLSADNAQFTRAYAQEAFGQHFLTDSFSAGHIRTPRREIDEWYTSVFAPQVFNHFLDTLRDRLVEGIYAQVARQSRGARIFSGRARDTIRDGVNQRLDRAFAQAGGRAVIVQWFGRIVGGAVSGAIHDMEGARGVQVSSQAHPAAWRAVGDARLQAPTNPAESAGAVETEAQARQAVLAAKGDIDHAFSIGQRERTARSATPDPRALPQTVYFGFDHYDITARARPALLNAASYLIYHPDTSVELMGNTDPIGSPDYNTGLGMRRAEAVNAFLTTQGAESSRISTSSAGETILVTRDARQYWRNRRVELVWRSIAVTQSRDPAYERALNAVLVEIGPPYGAERFIPIPVDGANPPIPDWHWGSIPLDLKAEISRYVTAQVGPFTSSVLNRHELDEFSEDDNTIQPRPIARAIVNDLLRDPVLFLEGATGRSAGSP
jgi:outer membrane protein OmpA-like peptidoglycan-associated protein